MPLILAIEPDRRQAAQLRSIVDSLLDSELVMADSADHALTALGNRVPDLILTAALLPPKEEVALVAKLRLLDGMAGHIQTLTIPVLAGPQPEQRGGMLSVLRRRPRKAAPDGCDPAVFADQCAEYLERAKTERASRAQLDERRMPDAPSLNDPQSPEPAVEPVIAAQAPAPEVVSEAEPIAELEIPLEVQRAEIELPEVALPEAVEVPIEIHAAAEPVGTLEPEPAPPEPEPEPVPLASAKASVPLYLGLARVWPEIEGLSADAEPLAIEFDPNADEVPTELPRVAPEPTVLLETERSTEIFDEAVDDTEAYEINVDELLKDLEPVLTAAPQENAPAPAPAPVVDLPETAPPAPLVEPDEPEEIAAQPPDDGPVVELEPAGATPLSAAGIEIDPALWTPSRLGVSQLWPPIEGGLATVRPVAFVDVTPTRPVEEAPAPAMSFSIPVSRQPADPEPPVRPAWLDVVESLRRDVERLQAERAQPPPAPLPPPAPPMIAADKAATPISMGAEPQPATGDASPPAASPEAAAPAAKETRGKSRSKGGKRPSRKSKGVQDEWGFFDPAQVGFAALLSKLDEITAESEDQTSSDS